MKSLPGAALAPPEMVSRPVICRLCGIQGQFSDVFAVDGLLVGGILGLQRETFGTDLDFGFSFANLKADIDCDAASDFEHDAGLLVGLEPRNNHAEVIGTSDQAWEYIEAGAVAFCGVGDLGSHIGDGDGGIRNHRSRGVLNGALQVGGSGDLCLRPGGEDQQDEKAKSDEPKPDR